MRKYNTKKNWNFSGVYILKQQHSRKVLFILQSQGGRACLLMKGAVLSSSLPNRVIKEKEEGLSSVQKPESTACAGNQEQHLGDVYRQCTHACEVMVWVVYLCAPFL